MNRNEVSITIGDKAISLRATFRCLANIEDKTGKPFTQIVQDAAEGKFRITDIVTILKEASKAAEQPLTEQEVDELLEQHGVLGMAQGLTQFLTIALYGGEDKLATSEKKTP